MPEFIFRIKRFLRFEPNEIKHIILSILVMAFIWGFDDKSDSFNFTHWLLNFAKVSIFIAIAVIMHITTQKIFALQNGYRAEYRSWTVGLVLGVILTLLTLGKFPLLMPGGIVLYHMTRQRIGDFRYGLNTYQAGLIAATGPFANLFFAMIVKTCQWIFSIKSPFLDQMFVFTLVFLFYMSLPIPPLPGVMMFFASKIVYSFLMGIIISYLFLLLVFSFYSLIWAIILGAVLFALYYWFFEKGETT
jgi:hypothetical protein